LKFLTAAHFRDTFCSNLPNFVEIGHTIAEISRFYCVLVKCKNSLNDCTTRGVTLWKLEIMK